MILTVPCSEIKCLYNTDGTCSLYFAKPIDISNIKQDKCLYYSEKTIILENQGQIRKTE